METRGVLLLVGRICPLLHWLDLSLVPVESPSTVTTPDATSVPLGLAGGRVLSPWCWGCALPAALQGRGMPAGCLCCCRWLQGFPAMFRAAFYLFAHPSTLLICNRRKIQGKEWLFFATYLSAWLKCVTCELGG